MYGLGTEALPGACGPSQSGRLQAGLPPLLLHHTGPRPPDRAIGPAGHSSTSNTLVVADSDKPGVTVTGGSSTLSSSPMKQVTPVARDPARLSSESRRRRREGGARRFKFLMSKQSSSDSEISLRPG